MPVPSQARRLSCVLAAALTFALSACGTGDDSDAPGPSSDRTGLSEDSASTPSREAQAFVLGDAWAPGGGREQVPIWPGEPPDARVMDGPEVTGHGSEEVAGRPWTYADRVATPTVTVYAAGRPEAESAEPGPAVVVLPGGGYNVVAMDLEGTEACDWLTGIGVTCVLLKYRAPCEIVRPYRNCPTAHQDAQRAVRLVRSRAAEWGIDPDRIGVLGFSAGGHMVATISTQYDEPLYPPVDEVDETSARPDFAMVLYPGHLAVEGFGFVLNPAVRVTAETPPTFLVHAYDDPMDPVENTLVYADSLRAAGVPTEVHVYATGGHAFGLRRTDAAVTAWPDRAEEWMRATGVLGQ